MLDCREEKMSDLERYCNGQSGDECFRKMRIFLAQLERHDANKTIAHPMSDFTNAVIYAISIYTTIGYGTISATYSAARIATILYSIFGIPLFFAFVQEEGNACRTVFIRLYNLCCKQDSLTNSSPWRVRDQLATECGSTLEQRRVFLLSAPNYP